MSEIGSQESDRSGIANRGYNFATNAPRVFIASIGAASARCFPTLNLVRGQAFSESSPDES